MIFLTQANRGFRRWFHIVRRDSTVQCIFFMVLCSLACWIDCSIRKTKNLSGYWVSFIDFLLILSSIYFIYQIFVSERKQDNSSSNWWRSMHQSVFHCCFTRLEQKIIVDPMINIPRHFCNSARISSIPVKICSMF